MIALVSLLAAWKDYLGFSHKAFLGI